MYKRIVYDYLMSNIVATFFHQCETCMHTFPKNTGVSLYQSGIQIVRSNQANKSLCESVLYRLLFLFPNCAELHYFMAHIILIHHPHEIYQYSSWFQTAFRLYVSPVDASISVSPPSSTNPIENLLDFMKILFDHDYTHYIQYLLDSYPDMFNTYTQDSRWLLFIGAYYIKTNQLGLADKIYMRLLPLCRCIIPPTLDVSTTIPANMQFQILNNALVLYMRMANFEWIQPLIKHNLQICNSMLHDDTIEHSTKVNLFCSNMLAYDYVYYDPAERIQFCSTIDQYFTCEPYSGKIPCINLSSDRIHIGYVSSDFILHVVSNFILPILEHHDRSCFNVTLFFTKYYTEFMGDDKYQLIREHCRVVNLQGMSTDDAVAVIRQLDIHVLFDLNGYTVANRLDIFAKQPAPIQISYLGYPNTVGSTKITQYRITDAIADPPDSQQWFAEKRLYMPQCFLLFRSCLQTEPLPFSRLGRSDSISWTIFGSMNRESKNSEELIYLWKQILLQTSHTKLLIKLNTIVDDELHIQRYYDKLNVGDAPGQIGKNRIIFVPYGTIDDYIDTFSQIDILLDSFPYSGTTTTCNALYNSIPVITLSHPHVHAHNVSASLLHHCQLSELIATTPEEYVDIAVQLSQDQPRLRWYRNTIHPQFQQLMNPQNFMPEYESMIIQTVSDRLSSIDEI